VNPASRWLDARYASHLARQDGAPLLVAMTQASEAEALGALQPGTYPIARGFGIEVREGPVKRFSDGGRP
jgi:hypothetical protein